MEIIWSNDLDFDDIQAWKDIHSDLGGLSEQELENILNSQIYSLRRDIEKEMDKVLFAPIVRVCRKTGLSSSREMVIDITESWNLKSCFFGAAFCTWFVDNKGEFRCEMKTATGKNEYLFRVMKKGMREVDEEFLRKCAARGQLTKSVLDNYTDKLGKAVLDAVTTEFPHKPPAKDKEMELEI